MNEFRRCERWRFRRALFLAVLGIGAAQCSAQSALQSRPVRIIVPSSAGGGTDTTTRLVASKMHEIIGQRVVVENRAGAASIVGTEVVARAAPDGHTLLAAISTIVINPHVHEKLPYDVFKDFLPVSQFVRLPNMLLGHPSAPARDVKELIALGRARPNELNFASAGVGSNLHLCMELFLALTKVKMVHVPYKGAGQAVADLVGGYVTLMVTNMITGTQQMKSGRLRAYGVTSAQRSHVAPDVPTLAEAGVPGYEATQWYGLVAPVGTPAEIIDKLYQGVSHSLKDANLRKQLQDSGADPIGKTPGEFATVMRADYEKWGKVIKSAGIKSQL
jgi:tripartite-type tricarboxylate transporter receptor subunit TctC